MRSAMAGGLSPWRQRWARKETFRRVEGAEQGGFDGFPDSRIPRVAPGDGSLPCERLGLHEMRALFSLSALPMTETELKLIAAAATAGDMTIPRRG